MAISINSCLKPSSLPTPTTNPSPLLAPRSTSNEVSWRSRCVSTMACVVIGSTAGFGGLGDGGVLARESELRFVVEGPLEGTKVVRWSDKIRKCPPWHLNSLENIMPENLPRLSDRRRSDGLASYKTAPAVGSSVRYNNSCYSL